jgi:hypothetical protein
VWSAEDSSAPDCCVWKRTRVWVESSVSPRSARETVHRAEPLPRVLRTDLSRVQDQFQPEPVYR